MGETLHRQKFLAFSPIFQNKMKWGVGDFWKAGIALEKPMTKFSAGLCFITNELIYLRFMSFLSVLLSYFYLCLFLLVHFNVST